MYGYNYEVHFDTHVIEDCGSLEKAKEKLKALGEDPGSTVLVDAATFWKDIGYGLKYRGDYAMGLELAERDEQNLASEQAKYKSFINAFLNDYTGIYRCSCHGGIYWGYSFLLVNEDRCLFIGAVAED